VESIEASAAQLAPGDPCRKQLTAWLAQTAVLTPEQRPPKPHRFDERKGSEAVRAQRRAAHGLAVQRWHALHAAWLVRNDARKKKARAARDAARDWKYVQRDRSEAAKKRRAARALLDEAREKVLLHLKSVRLSRRCMLSGRRLGILIAATTMVQAAWTFMLMLRRKLSGQPSDRQCMARTPVTTFATLASTFRSS